VRKLLRLVGRDDVPVMVGAGQSLLRYRPVHWEGTEGEGFLTEGDEGLALSSERASDFLARTVMDNPGQIHLLAIGPLTNVALAFLREPQLPARLAHLTIMGGAVRGHDSLDLPYAEYNIECDPEAAHLVLTAGAPTTLVPLDVTTRVEIRADGVARLRAAGSPVHDALADQIERYPTFVERGATYMHDPLAAATILKPNIVDLRPLHVDIEIEGPHAGMTLMREPIDDAPHAVQVALSVAAAEAEEFILGRVLAINH
jgi:purine nucleosidase